MFLLVVLESPVQEVLQTTEVEAVALFASGLEMLN